MRKSARQENRARATLPRPSSPTRALRRSEEESMPPESTTTPRPRKRPRLCKRCAALARRGSCRSSLLSRADFCGVWVSRFQALDDRDETRITSDRIHNRHHHGPIGMTAELTCETFQITEGEFVLAKEHEHDRNLVA